MPKVSIGLPCFNEAAFIEETLKSVLAQTEEDFELLVCDNASTDGTLEIIKRVTAGDPRVTIHPSTVNAGALTNFIRALELASCPYFMWMGAHDVLAKDYVKKLRLVLDADAGCSLAYANSIFIAKDGSDIPGERVEEGPDCSAESPLERFKAIAWQLERCDLIHGLIRREWIVKQLFTSCRAPDIVLLADLALRGKFRRVPELMFYRRQVRESETPEQWKKRQEEQGIGDPAQSVADSWVSIRDAHMDLPAAASLSPSQKHDLRAILYQAFLERHGVAWDASQEESTAWERLRLRFAGKEAAEFIRQHIRQRVAMKARIDDASSRARMERELVSLMKENHRLRKELARLKQRPASKE